MLRVKVDIIMMDIHLDKPGSYLTGQFLAQQSLL